MDEQVQIRGAAQGRISVEHRAERRTFQSDRGNAGCFERSQNARQLRTESQVEKRRAAGAIAKKVPNSGRDVIPILDGVAAQRCHPVAFGESCETLPVEMARCWKNCFVIEEGANGRQQERGLRTRAFINVRWARRSCDAYRHNLNSSGTRMLRRSGTIGVLNDSSHMPGLRTAGPSLAEKGRQVDRKLNRPTRSTPGLGGRKTLPRRRCDRGARDYRTPSLPPDSGTAQRNRP